MFKHTRTTYYTLGAAMTAGMIMPAKAAFAGTASFNNIATNINTSIQDLPGLLTALSYLFGIILGVLGVMKIKDHVENPSNTPLKDGAIRLAAGGALFALPIIFDAMNTTIGGTTAATATQSAKLKKVSFGVE